jgi:hypothetical protein
MVESKIRLIQECLNSTPASLISSPHLELPIPMFDFETKVDFQFMFPIPHLHANLKSTDTLFTIPSAASEVTGELNSTSELHSTRLHAVQHTHVQHSSK